MKQLATLSAAILFLVGGGAQAEPADTITTGLVFAYGNELPSPYRLEIVENTVRINGIQVFPTLAETGEPQPGPSDELPPEPSRSVFALKARLEAEGMPLDEITAQMAAYMETQEGVDSVTWSPPGGTLRVYRRGGPAEIFFTYKTLPPPTMEMRCKSEFQRLRHELQSNTIVVFSSFAGFACPNTPAKQRELRAVIEKARRTTEDEFLTWKLDMITARMAREFKHPLPLKGK